MGDKFLKNKSLNGGGAVYLDNIELIIVNNT